MSVLEVGNSLLEVAIGRLEGETGTAPGDAAEGSHPARIPAASSSALKAAPTRRVLRPGMSRSTDESAMVAPSGRDDPTGRCAERERYG
jgi:hypothetical protein